jgi:hypothetical protein
MTVRKNLLSKTVENQFFYDKQPPVGGKVKQRALIWPLGAISNNNSTEPIEHFAFNTYTTLGASRYSGSSSSS